MGLEDPITARLHSAKSGGDRGIEGDRAGGIEEID
jgi:hypothetical protein